MSRCRRSLRAPAHDYRSPGAYFVTLVAARHRSIFGRITDDRIAPSRLGCAVVSCWEKIGDLHPDLTLDAYVVMPNHVHGILLMGLEAPTDMAPPVINLADRLPHGPAPGSLGAIIGQFKAAVTRRARDLGITDAIWQRNFHERVLRSERAVEQVRRYIENNPAQWARDALRDF